jgi:regulatory protein
VEASPDDPLALALRALAQKERSVAELGEWLRSRGVAEQDTETVLSYLVEIGTLDDERFALRFAEDKREIAGWGNDRIRDALLARGVGSTALEAALGAEETGDELDRAVAALHERGFPLRGERERGKAYAFLTRRGFNADTAYEAIRRAANGSDLA